MLVRVGRLFASVVLITSFVTAALFIELYGWRSGVIHMKEQYHPQFKTVDHVLTHRQFANDSSTDAVMEHHILVHSLTSQHENHSLHSIVVSPFFVFFFLQTSEEFSHATKCVDYARSPLHYFNVTTFDSSRFNRSSDHLPKEVDWRTMGAVSGVKDSVRFVSLGFDFIFITLWFCGVALA